MDIEHISADGIPLNIADTQARQDITEIKSNLTNLTNAVEVTFSDYINITRTHTVNSEHLWRITKNLYYVQFDYAISLTAGYNTIGTMKKPMTVSPQFIAGRYTNTTSAYPATAIFVSNGDIRIQVYANATGSCCGGFLYIDD